MASPAAADNKLLAILCVCGAIGIATSGDSVVKWLSGSYPVHQLLIIRCVVGIPILAFILYRNASLKSLTGPGTGLSMARGFILSSAYLAYILAIAAMPLADAVAIYFAMPLFVAIIAGPLLGERVRAHRWIAIIGGFIGVVIMINPGGGVLEPAALLALYSAAAYALSQTLARRIMATVPPAAMAFHNNAAYLTVAVALALIFTGLDIGAVHHKSLAFLTRPWHSMPMIEFAAAVLLGASVAIAMVLFATAYRNAESSFVAPFEYTSMFWAIALGFVVFGDVPGARTLWGGAIVLIAGLFMLWADRRIDRIARKTVGVVGASGPGV